MMVLVLKDISKSFGGLKAVDNLSLEIGKGAIAGLIGPNGSGKTTLFNVISGIYKPDAGEIYFENEQIDKLPPYEVYKRGVVRSFQIPRLFKKMTILDNMVIAGRSQEGDSFFKVFKKSAWKSQEEELLEKAVSILNFLGYIILEKPIQPRFLAGSLSF